MGRGRTGAHQYLSARRRAKINKPGLQMRLSLEKGLPEPPLQNRLPRLVNKPSRHEEALCKGPPLLGTQWRTRRGRSRGVTALRSLRRYPAGVQTLVFRALVFWVQVPQVESLTWCLTPQSSGKPLTVTYLLLLGHPTEDRGSK